MQVKKIIFISFCGLFLSWSAGCGGGLVGDTPAAGRACLWVTRDFGAAEIYNSEVEFAATDSVMTMLQQYLEVETEYGGGFVNAIAGLKSGYTGKVGEDQQMLDWFFYMNGIISGVGALDYAPGDGDVIWWDYHAWGEISFTPAVIGAFPQPFLNGYRGSNPGTLILIGKGCDRHGECLASFLQEQGAELVEIRPYAETLAGRRTRITIVVAPWDQLKESSFWQGIQENRAKTGWFAELTPDAFYPLDMHGIRGEGYSGLAGAVLATGTGMGDPTPLWLITSLNQEGLGEVIDLVVYQPEQLQMMIGALIVGKEVIALPQQR
ncbi:MAG: DUF4430 domain-containing protein [Bacillota bacterium]